MEIPEFNREDIEQMSEAEINFWAEQVTYKEVTAKKREALINYFSRVIQPILPEGNSNIIKLN